MKRLLFLFLLWPGVALAQVGPEVYAVATPAHVIGFDSTNSVGITSGFVSRIIRATCTAACFLSVNLSGQSVPVTKSTGAYLPANFPILFSVTPGSKVQVVGDTTSGKLNVVELSK